MCTVMLSVDECVLCVCVGVISIVMYAISEQTCSGSSLYNRYTQKKSNLLASYQVMLTHIVSCFSITHLCSRVTLSTVYLVMSYPP